jgi:hypothetical protein
VMWPLYHAVIMLKFMDLQLEIKCFLPIPVRLFGEVMSDVIINISNFRSRPGS